MPRQRHVEDDPIIFAYTRAQAIADGVLIDITDEAKACGFQIPVAITATLFHRYVAVGKDLEEYGQSTQARLQDVLTVLFFRIRSLPKRESSRELRFHVRFLMDVQVHQGLGARYLNLYEPLCGVVEHVIMNPTWRPDFNLVESKLNPELQDFIY